MQDLTERQIQILKSLIEEYIETANAVGSETLEKKHSLSASPATIRNEMVKLTELGYLQKAHSSAGRIPTSMGMKFYVGQLMKEKEPSVAEEVAMKEKLWDYREQNRRFMKEIVKTLADKTKTLAIATTSEGDVYCAGYSHILDMPEFFDIDMTKTLLSAIDEGEQLNTMFANIADDDEVHILLGDDLEAVHLQGPYSMVLTHYQTPLHMVGQVGVIGPTRLNYRSIVPVVRIFGGLIEEIAKGW